ncbi:hypothetical protein SAMN04487904_10416 [Actinopolyspora lacussalsi subsp. righensis]|uniref:Uncharacterized protein n=1 Tax=Actinopolyspora righensis TaxID=995060 RepID=A0A1I6Z6F2_9ACTN|nr:hypothetical protein [Actinopolyspora righensis]SFT58286.1 hypothetical protein SAMN04487904_10416 [Actinopolyspora righensis]
MTREECIEAAGRILARARARRDSLPIEEAYYPGGPSRESIRAQIIRQRYEAEEVAARPAQ